MNENLTKLINAFNPSGKDFEKTFAPWYFKNDPYWKHRIEDIWLWDDYPNKWTGQDLGTDLVIEMKGSGDIWAVQAKNYASDHYIGKPDIDSFISHSRVSKVKGRILLATTDNIGSNAEKTFLLEDDKDWKNILLTQLHSANIDYPDNLDGLRTPAVPLKPLEPRCHQKKAITKAIEGFTKEDRGQVIMACGTGKTLVGIKIKEQLQSKLTLVLFPSLTLLSEAVIYWTRNSNNIDNILCVCSDKTVAKKGKNANDEMVTSTKDVPFLVTSHSDEIKNFINSGYDDQIIFSTYQSSELVSIAQKDTSKEFDLIIFDEAHKTATKKPKKSESYYSLALGDKNIKARKRLFLTATPRIYGVKTKDEFAENSVELISMSDPKYYGKEFFAYPFKEAIEKKMLSDYQIIVIGVTDTMVKDQIDNRQIIAVDDKTTMDANAYAMLVAVQKVLEDYDIRRSISFHSRVDAAKQFSDQLSYIQFKNNTKKINTDHIQGSLPVSSRIKILDKFNILPGDERLLISNARCLSEGIDVPALDGVVFVDPKYSTVDIVQSVGRAIRLNSDDPDKIGKIIIPIFIDQSDEDYAEEKIISSQFSQLYSIINALKTHDDTLVDELNNIRYQLGKKNTGFRRGGENKVILDLPSDLPANFEESFYSILIDKTSESFYFWLSLLESYKEQHGDCRVPARHKTSDGFNLGTWVSNQRTLFKNKILTEEKIKILNALGFIWDPLEEDFSRGIEYLSAYKEQHGDCRVLQSHKTSDGFNLGRWAGSQRTLFKNKILTEEKIKILNALGFIWDLLEEDFKRGIEYLSAYKEQHGDCRVVHSHKTSDGFNLGTWVSTQRASFKNKILTEEKIKILNALGFIWDPLEEDFKRGIEYLSAYKEQHGDCRVVHSHKTSDGFNLGFWVSTQRTSFKNKILTEEKIKILDDLGFIWDLLEEYFSRGIEYLSAYKEQHGDCRVPDRHKTSDGFNLGKWVSNQRTSFKNKILTEEKIKILNDLGFIWDLLEEYFPRGIEYLSAYKEQHGDCRVPARHKTSDGFNLGFWVSTQRTSFKNKILTEEKIKILNDLGFIWDLLEEYFSRGIEYLSAYKEQHGDCRVHARHKTSDGFNLGIWVGNRRRNFKNEDEYLSQEKIKILNALGFIWDASKK